MDFDRLHPRGLLRVDYPTTVLLLCMLGFFGTYFIRVAISPVIPVITDYYQVSNSLIGLALTGMWLFYGLSQFPSGILADRYGEKPLVLLSLGGTTVACALLALAPMFAVFFLFVVVLGATAGIHYPAATTLLSNTVEDTGFAIGLHSAAGPLAGLVAPVVVTWISVQYGWRPAIAVTILVTVPALLLFFVFVRDTPPRRPETSVRDRINSGVVSSLLSDRAILFYLFIAVLGTFVAQVLISFLPTFLVEFRGQPATLAGTLFAFFFVVRTGGQAGIGHLSDRIGRPSTLALCMATGVAGFAALVVVPGFTGVILGILGVGTASGFFAALDSQFMDILPEADQGAGFGLVRAVYGVLGSLGSFGIGVLTDLYGWGVAFATLGIICAIATVALVANILASRT